MGIGVGRSAASLGVVRGGAHRSGITTWRTVAERSGDLPAERPYVAEYAVALGFESESTSEAASRSIDFKKTAELAGRRSRHPARVTEVP